MLLPLFHEIAHAHRDPATSEKMLKNARWRYFSVELETLTKTDPGWMNHDEFMPIIDRIASLA